MELHEDTNPVSDQSVPPGLRCSYCGSHCVGHASCPVSMIGLGLVQAFFAMIVE